MQRKTVEQITDELIEATPSKDVILRALESAMVAAYRRVVKASSAQHVEAKVDADTGKVKVFAEKEVVEDVQEPMTEVLLEEARKVNPDAQLGDMVIVETTPPDFGLVAAQTARQVMRQRIREAEIAQNAQRIVLSYPDEDSQPLSADNLISSLGVYIKALSEIQALIDVILKRPHLKVRIVEITQRSPVNVTLDGGAEAIKLVRESITPWRKRHAEIMSQLEEQEKQLEIEKAKASILETRANAAKTRAEEENLRSEAAKKYQEAESLRLANEKLQIDIQRAKIDLLISIVNQFAQELSEQEKFLYMTKLLGPVGIIIESKYQIVESK